MTDAQVQVPDELDFNADELNTMAEGEANRRFREDVWFRTLVTDAERQVSKNEKKRGLQFMLTLSFLEEEENEASVNHSIKLRNWVNTPKHLLPPTDDPEEIADREYKALVKRDMMVENFTALFGPEEYPEVPRAYRGKYTCSDGTELTEDEVQKRARITRTKALQDVVVYWRNNGKDFVGCAPYIRVKYENGDDRPSVAAMQHCLPPGAEFVPASQAYVTSTKVVAAAVPPPPKPNGKPVKKSSRRRK